MLLHKSTELLICCFSLADLLSMFLKLIGINIHCLDLALCGLVGAIGIYAAINSDPSITLTWHDSLTWFLSIILYFCFLCSKFMELTGIMMYGLLFIYVVFRLYRIFKY